MANKQPNNTLTIILVMDLIKTLLQVGNTGTYAAPRKINLPTPDHSSSELQARRKSLGCFGPLVHRWTTRLRGLQLEPTPVHVKYLMCLNHRGVRISLRFRISLLSGRCKDGA